MVNLQDIIDTSSHANGDDPQPRAHQLIRNRPAECSRKPIVGKVVRQSTSYNGLASLSALRGNSMCNTHTEHEQRGTTMTEKHAESASDCLVAERRAEQDSEKAHQGLQDRGEEGLVDAGHLEKECLLALAITDLKYWRRGTHSISDDQPNT